MLSLAYMFMYETHEIFLVNARKLNQEVIKDSHCFNLKTRQSKTTEFKELLYKILRSHKFFT